MAFARPPAFDTSSVFHDYSTVSDGAGALVISAAWLGCESGSVFKFTLSLLSDCLPGLAYWDQNLLLFPRTYFFLFCMCRRKKKKNQFSSKKFVSSSNRASYKDMGARLAKIIPRKHRTESRNGQDLESENPRPLWALGFWLLW